MSSVPEPNNNISTESSEGGNVIPPRKFKNPTTIEEMNDMRAQIRKDKDLKARVKREYVKKVRIEAQGQVYSPPEDLKQFKILIPKRLKDLNISGNIINDTSTKDISDEVFVGEK